MTTVFERVIESKEKGNNITFSTSENSITNLNDRGSHNKRSSYKERKVNALALGAEEGRG